MTDAEVLERLRIDDEPLWQAALAVVEAVCLNAHIFGDSITDSLDAFFARAREEVGE